MQALYSSEDVADSFVEMKHPGIESVKTLQFIGLAEIVLLYRDLLTMQASYPWPYLENT